MAAMVSEADCPPQTDDVLRDAQSRLDTAEKALELAVQKEWALDTTLFVQMRWLEKIQTQRESKKKLASRGQRSNPTEGMKLEAVLYTMDKMDKELSDLRLKHGIVSQDDSPLLPDETAEQRHWHTWLYNHPDGLFEKEPGWEIEAEEAWKTWVNHLDDVAAKN